MEGEAEEAALADRRHLAREIEEGGGKELVGGKVEDLYQSALLDDEQAVGIVVGCRHKERLAQPGYDPRGDDRVDLALRAVGVESIDEIVGRATGENVYVIVANNESHVRIRQLASSFTFNASPPRSGKRYAPGIPSAMSNG